MSKYILMNYVWHTVMPREWILFRQITSLRFLITLMTWKIAALISMLQKQFGAVY